MHSSLLTSCMSMKPWAYEMIFDAYRACSRLARNSSLLPVNLLRLGPSSSLEARVRSSLSELRHLAKTASPMRVTGMPRSRALIAVHFPVPFWPAESRIFSTNGVPSSSLKRRTSRVISMRKESRTPRFHFAKMSPISLSCMPKPRFMMSYA